MLLMPASLSLCFFVSFEGKIVCADKLCTQILAQNRIFQNS